ncbi:phycobilisome rod-core linker polypeptide [Oscillatoria salina]|uniref:phycobilisome rod-core linker polypeptide n=1 Tax=Oscillatoria salina TaxID=331517 RepID=UPI0013BCF834|nr:phycobilisome rod-core linker polypeptide [Oscillatoria salina]MBZ8181045.1 phycobilisome rod-core linker polypeptide CpcG [Oscillatoria salina IIICB1]NET90420.1 phycobilisome rod-core linker polypeptide CpcG [Kamptonema sp. SIO1D9]
MALPLLEYSPSSQNQRVAGYDSVSNEEQPYIYSTELRSPGAEMDEVIWAAYRQIFSEHQILKYNRQTVLESQLRYGQLNVRDFIRGLATCEAFRRLNYEPNDNYRFVELCVQRILGRDVYNEREKIAWSIVLVTKGLTGFIDTLLDSEEYLNNFGYDKVPYQRRRVLLQHDSGETPFNLKTPRYGEYHRGQLGFPQIVWQNPVRRFIPQDKIARAGDPSQFLGMARGLNAQNNTTPKVGAGNIDYLSKVPYRRR